MQTSQLGEHVTRSVMDFPGPEDLTPLNEEDPGVEKITANAYVPASLRPVQNEDDMDPCKCPECTDEGVKDAAPTCTGDECSYYASRTQCPASCRKLRRCHNRFFRDARYTKAVEVFDVSSAARAEGSVWGSLTRACMGACVLYQTHSAKGRALRVLEDVPTGGFIIEYIAEAYGEEERGARGGPACPPAAASA